MSVVNDATARAREQLAAAESVLAALREQLTAIPGWLRVGDPERHTDPGDLTAARQAVALDERITRVRRAVAQFAVRVERALGEPPDSIWSWVAFRPWLESLPSDGAQQLLDGLVTSPERLLTDQPRMSPAKAQAILDYIAGHGGAVGDGELFRQGVPLDAADLADLEATGFQLRGAKDPSGGWDVLLPVRLETRFLRPGQPGPDPTDPADADQTVWRLLVRVEPDAPSLATAPAVVTAAQSALVPICWTECAGNLTTDDGETAFLKLAGRVGAARAAYLLRSVSVVRSGDGFALAEPETFPQRVETVAEPLIGLPSTLEIWAGPEGAPGLLATLRPDRATMAATATLDSVAQPEDGQTPRRWWNSYAAAREVQLAVEIPFGAAPPDLPVLFCVGYDEPGAEPVEVDELFGRHADAGRLGTMTPLTPTNTVAGAPTVDLGRDPQPWWPAARDLPGPDGGLWTSLTGRPDAPGMPAPDLSRSDVATSIITALWPVLWQRSLKDNADGSEDIWRLGEWAGRHLHPFGPFPVLRVGDLPYGVLPVSAYGRWVWRKPEDRVRAGDPRPEFTALAALPVLDRPLLELALAQGNAVGADTDRLLDLLEHVPTSRAYGSRQIPATVLLDALTAALGASAPGDKIREWEDQFGYLRGAWPPGPRRRYSPVLDIEPLPRKVDPDYRELLRHYLDVTWSLLAEANDLADQWRLHGEPPAVLARLIRQALLITQAEVTRLLPLQPSSFLLPMNDVQQFMSLASGGQGVGRVAELPKFAQDLVRSFGGDPRAAAVCRQFEDVRDAVLRLSEPEPTVAEAVLPAVLDLTGHRVDAWWTGLAHRRLGELIAAGGTPRLGCYGWVDDLSPNPDPTAPTAAGLIHAPGYTQALTAAVLRDQAVHHADQNQWRLTLESDTIRTAAALAEQVRGGVHLSEALGREVERLVGDPALVLTLRQAFPARPEWEGRRVCDGQQVLDAVALPPGIDGALFDSLRTALDAYADLLVSDALHDVVEGRATAAAEALEASAGLGAPPELRLLKTQRGGSTVKTTALVAWSWRAEWDTPDPDAASPVSIADPALGGLLASELPGPAAWTWTAEPSQVTLTDLDLELPDLLMLTAEQLAALAGGLLGEAPTGGTGPGNYRRLAAICGALGGGIVAEPAASVLRTRLAVLRARADGLAAELAAPEPNTAAAAWRWGLAGDDLASALPTLLGRIDQLGPAGSDATASAETLAERIRTLLPSALALSLAVPQPTTTWNPLPDDDWLEVVAAVRPALARLEVAQLTAAQPWLPAASDDQPVWAPGDLTGSAHRDLTIAYRPADLPGADPDREAAVVIDRWAETVPAQAHTTWAAFGYDAPRARPQQAILIVVPPDLDALSPADDLRDAVLEARRLTRIRAVRPPLAPEVALMLPTSMIIDENVTPSGAVLGREA